MGVSLVRLLSLPTRIAHRVRIVTIGLLTVLDIRHRTGIDTSEQSHTV